MSSSGSVAGLVVVENLCPGHLVQWSDDQFLQKLDQVVALAGQEMPPLQELACPQSGRSEPSSNLTPARFAQQVRAKWIKKGVVDRAEKLFSKTRDVRPNGIVSWSEGRAGSFGETWLCEQLGHLSCELDQVLAQAPRTTKKRRERAAVCLDQFQEILAARKELFPQVSAVELLWVIEIFLKTGRLWKPAGFWKIWRWLLTQFVSYRAERDTYMGTEATAARVLLVEGELAWVGGLLFGNLAGFKELRKAGKRVLGAALAEQVDNDGTPAASLMPNLADWLAPLVRSPLWGTVFEKKLWKKREEELYDMLLQSAARYCRNDGSLAFSPQALPQASGEMFSPETFSAEMLRLAMKVSGFSSSAKPVKYLAHVTAASPGEKQRLVVKSRKWGNARQSVSSQSDWARLACMRTSWALDADTLLVTHDEEFPRIEMSTLGNTLLAGAWDLELKISGRKRKLVTDWTCSCWYSDREIDYLELQLSLTDRLHVDRQLVLSRKDHFALLAESVSGAGDQKTELTSHLSLAPGLTGAADLPTREIDLAVASHRVRVFPLGLPQFRTARGTGEVALQPEKIELKTVGQGGGMNALFFDWHPRRSREQAEWNTLTITENRRVTRPDEAFAARMRLKNRQWLFYRALQKSPEWPRALLGLHTNYETVLGKFDSKGNIVPLVNVE